MQALSSLVLVVSTVLCVLTRVRAFDINSGKNLVTYWGQNSAADSTPDDLGKYCESTNDNVIVLSFVNVFGNNLNISLNLANACTTTFGGSTLLHCPNVAAGIKTCQKKGVAVLMSMGGGAGSYGFTGDTEAKQVADTMWNMFLGGSASQRPFDDAILDGIDLDIEGGSITGYTAFIGQLRAHFAANPNKSYYISAAPQCPFPDAHLGTTLNQAKVDMLFIQFYNNYCMLGGTQFNYATWNTWAQSSAYNKGIKLFIGVPASSSAAGSGYVTPAVINSTVINTRKNSSFGGIMQWDASQARKNVINGKTFDQLMVEILTGPSPPSSGSVSTKTVTSLVTVISATTKTAAATATATITKLQSVTKTVTQAVATQRETIIEVVETIIKVTVTKNVPVTVFKTSPPVTIRETVTVHG